MNSKGIFRSLAVSLVILGAEGILGTAHSVSSRGLGSSPFYFSDFFDRGFENLGSGYIGGSGVDVCSNETQNEITVELPGIDRKTLIITVLQDHVLVIEAQKKTCQQREKAQNCWFRGRSQGQIRRELSLGFFMDPKKAKAWYEDGVLTIVFEKSPTHGQQDSQISLSDAPSEPLTIKSGAMPSESKKQAALRPGEKGSSK